MQNCLICYHVTSSQQGLTALGHAFISLDAFTEEYLAQALRLLKEDFIRQKPDFPNPGLVFTSVTQLES